AFLDNVVTSTLVLEGEGRVAEYVGGYSDWLQQRPQDSAPAPGRAPAAASAAQAPPAAAPRAAGSARLGYREQRELAGLPARIESTEAALGALHAQLADPEIYRSGGERIAQVQAQAALLQQ